MAPYLFEKRERKGGKDVRKTVFEALLLTSAEV